MRVHLQADREVDNVRKEIERLRRETEAVERERDELRKEKERIEKEFREDKTRHPETVGVKHGN